MNHQTAVTIIPRTNAVPNVSGAVSDIISENTTKTRQNTKGIQLPMYPAANALEDRPSMRSWVVTSFNMESYTTMLALYAILDMM